MWLTYVLGTPEAIAHLPCKEDSSQMRTAVQWVERRLSRGAQIETPAAPRHLLLCDMAAMARPHASGAERIWAGAQIGGESQLAPADAHGLLLNQMDIDAAHEDEFNDWYNTEHLPRIAAVDGVIAARRFRSDADAPHYLAAYHLRGLDVVLGDAWQAAAATPWTARMRRYRTGLIRLGFEPAAGL